MNLKVLGIILLYYSILGMFFLIGSPYLYEGDLVYNFTGNLSNFDVSNSTGSFGVLGTGVDLGRFWMLMSMGIGLPTTIPIWIQITFFVWQTAFSIFVAGFIISAIWNG